ncbi:MAG TPA: PQQ-binding-like beta-propeller repeat protein [Acidobacteriota bacterium]|nr:PQQ-binding-like beta-propeller repeat protein [Acidobacteriota bacterium]
MRFCTLCIILLLFLTVPLAAQNVGDQATAAYNPQRTGLNQHMGDFNPPLRLVREVTLGGVASAESCVAFEDFLVVGEAEVDPNPVRYSLFDLRGAGNTLTPLLTTTFPGSAETLDFTPSYANNILLLGGPATSTVKAIRVSTLGEIWQDETIGSSQGRHPVVSGDLALYAGSQKIVARQASSGITLWESETTVAQAPLVAQGDRAYLLQSDGALTALRLDDGSPLWSLAFIGSDGSWLTASEKYVFVTNPSGGAYGAIRVSDQTLAWVETGDFTLSAQGVALAYDRLFVFLDDNGQGDAEIRIHDPDSGDLLETIAGGEGPLRFPSLANNNLIYWQEGRLLIRDAFSGVLLDSRPAPDLRAVLADDGQLLLLFAQSLQIWEPSGEIYFAQVADGEGQSTLLTLVNLSAQEASGQVDFVGAGGEPLNLPVQNVIGTVSSVDFTIPGRSSLRVQTADGDTLRSGWARVSADRPLRGSSLFQFSEAGAVLFEAGVGQSAPVGEALVFVQRDMAISPVDGVTPVVFSTAVAVANPSEDSVQVILTLLDADGVEAGFGSFMLDGGQRLARFIEELFPDDVGETFEGSLRIRADLPIVVTSLRTSQGFQLSSLPAGQVR